MSKQNGTIVKIKPQPANKAATASYKSQSNYVWVRRAARDLPPLTAIIARQIILDPTVKLGLAARLAPLLSSQIAYKDGDKWVDGVRASSPAVADYVYRQFQTIFRYSADVLNSAQIWGHGAAELVDDDVPGSYEIDKILVRQAADTRAIMVDGDVGGVQFRRVMDSDDGMMNLSIAKSLWHAHAPEPGEVYGTSVLTAPYSPWWDKHSVGGALDIRRLFMTKDGYRGMRCKYPAGTTVVAQPDGSSREIPNYEIAMEIVEHLKTGGVFALPSECDANGKPLWVIEEATVASNPQHILQYPKDLDSEILNALGIADDVLKSEATGSWAGKVVPQQATYCILEQWLVRYVSDINRTIRERVRLKFGDGHRYQVTTKPLAEQMLEQQNKAEPQVGQSGFDDPSGFAQVNQNRLPSPSPGAPHSAPSGAPPQQRMSLDPIGDVGADLRPAKDLVDAVRLIHRLEHHTP